MYLLCFSTTGYLNTQTYVIHSYTDGKEVRRPDGEERAWIIANCRVGEVQSEVKPVSQSRKRLDPVSMSVEEKDYIHPMHRPADEQPLVSDAADANGESKE